MDLELNVGVGALQEGLLLLQQGELEGASARFQQVLQSDPANARALGYLGVCLVQQGQLAAGIAALQRAAQMQPYDAGAQYNLAAAQVQAQQTGEARANLERALALDPNHAKARIALEKLGGPISTPVPQPSPDAISGFPSPAYPGEGNAPSSDGRSGVAPTPLYFPPPSSVMPLTVPLPDTAPEAPPPSSPAPYALPPPMPTASPQGMAYSVPGMQLRNPGMAVPTGTRILRGLGWGALYGQAFTAWTALRVVLSLGSLSGSESLGAMAVGMAVLLLASGIVFAFLGSLLGLVIAATKVKPEVGAILGIVAGGIALGLQTLIGMRSGVTVIFGLLVAFSLGRYVGSNITARVRRPIQP